MAKAAEIGKETTFLRSSKKSGRISVTIGVKLLRDKQNKQKPVGVGKGEGEGGRGAWRLRMTMTGWMQLRSECVF